MSTWRACSTCKKPIAFGATYYACSVSTCLRPATNFAFCAMDCWDAHVPTFRHKEAWAEERKAPSSAEVALASAPTVSAAKAVSPMPKVASPVAGPPAARVAAAAPEREVLIVASKLKGYITAKSQMSTSASVMDVLSDRVRKMCDEAIERAQRDGRKTVMDRDF